MPLSEVLPAARSIAIIVLVLSTLPVALVLVLYTRIYRTIRRKLPEGQQPTGLIPKHVALVSLYAFCVQWTLVWGLAEQLQPGPPSPWAQLARYTIYTLLGLLLITSVVAIGKHSNRRVTFARGRIVEVREAEQTQIREDER